jgi:hypothetical protein
VSHGHAGDAGIPASGRQTTLIAAAPIAINVVLDKGSRPTLISAFHPAWHAAAKRTATKTKLSTRGPYTGDAASAIGVELGGR